MTLVERFLKYVSFDTQSSEETEITPSTPGQMVFARYLKEELESLGLEEITLDENGYLFATLPARQAVARHRLYCPHGYKPRYEWQECFSAYRAEL